MFSLVSSKFLSMRNITLYSVYNCWSQLSQEFHSQICPRNLIHSVSRILVKNSAYILVKFCGHLPWPQCIVSRILKKTQLSSVFSCLKLKTTILFKNVKRRILIVKAVDLSWYLHLLWWVPILWNGSTYSDRLKLQYWFEIIRIARAFNFKSQFYT